MEPTLGVVFGLAAMISWGLSDFFVVKPVREVGICRSFIWNQISGLIILPIALALWGHIDPINLSEAISIACAGICGIVGSLAFYKGMKIGNVSVITPIVATWSVVTVLGAVIIFGESLTALQTGGVALAVCGTCLVSVKLSDIRKVKNAELAKGVGFAIVALVAFGLQFVFLNSLSHSMNWIEAISLTRLFVVAASLVLFIFMHLDISFPREVYSSIALIALFEVVGFLAYGQGIAVQQSSIIAPISATHPLVTIMLAFFLLRERLEPNQLLGIGSVICGIIILSL